MAIPFDCYPKAPYGPIIQTPVVGRLRELPLNDVERQWWVNEILTTLEDIKIDSRSNSDLYKGFWKNGKDLLEGFLVATKGITIDDRPPKSLLPLICQLNEIANEFSPFPVGGSRRNRARKQNIIIYFLYFFAFHQIDSDEKYQNLFAKGDGFDHLPWDQFYHLDRDFLDGELKILSYEGHVYLLIMELLLSVNMPKSIPFTFENFVELYPCYVGTQFNLEFLAARRKVILLNENKSKNLRSPAYFEKLSKCLLGIPGIYRGKQVDLKPKKLQSPLVLMLEYVKRTGDRKLKNKKNLDRLLPGIMSERNFNNNSESIPYSFNEIKKEAITQYREYEKILKESNGFLTTKGRLSFLNGVFESISKSPYGVRNGMDYFYNTTLHHWHYFIETRTGFKQKRVATFVRD